MNVTLAGYNVDADIIDELKKKSEWTKDNVTPETLSAAYARISRDPSDIGKLREMSREQTSKARKSNEMIIFGLGHASVAEHAVFNFDIVGISRLAVEEIQKYRLASFTEKSQRYITLDGDYYFPEKLKGTKLEKKFKNLVDFQNEVYFSLYNNLQADLFKKHEKLISTKRGKMTVDGWAKEDARYVVSLATNSQFGMTANARTLEHMLRRFRASKLSEIRELAEKLYEAVHPLSPSIIRYTEPTPYDTERSDLIRKITAGYSENSQKEQSSCCNLISITENPDRELCAALLFNYTDMEYETCIRKAEEMSLESKEELVRASLCSRECFDRVERAFEAVDFTFEVTVSASSYAQLKRHRISTQIVQDYSTELGVTVPPSIKKIQGDCFNQVIERSEKLYTEIAKEFPEYKEYALTNAHRRRVLLKINARELYHFMSLRADEHAQWDIRNTAQEMLKLAQKAAPLTSMMLTGKSDFDECKKEVFPC